MTRRLVLVACDVSLVLVILSIPHPLSVAVAELLFALVTAVLVTEIVAALTGDEPDWGRLIRRGDHVSPETAARLRAEGDAAAELEERLGVTRAKRPERRERARSANGAFRRPWGDGRV